MTTDPFILFRGLEHMVTGIAIPFCIAIGACLVRVAFWGWTGFKAFAANFTISFVLGAGAHWLMTDMDVGGSTRLFVTLGVALISRDILDTLFSRRTRRALQERLAYEIGARFRGPLRREPAPPHGRDARHDFGEDAQMCERADIREEREARQ